MSKPTLLRAWVPVLSAAMLVGCSSFNADYQSAAEAPPVEGSVEGAWVGTWRSEVSDHNGALRAIVTKAGDDVYSVRYHATYDWLWTMEFEMDIQMHGQTSGETFHFEGKEDLGFPYGEYTYSGYMTEDDFFSTYEAQGDRGVYQLFRPAVRVEATE